MPTREEWLASISASERTFEVTAQSYRGIKFSSFSAPVVLGCDDGEDYVVKIPKAASLFRAICNDQVIGHVAKALLAPVPEVRIINIPQALIDGEPALLGAPAGPAHGSRYMPNVSKTREGIAFADLPNNRGRFSILAAMYGLAGCFSDHQFFYEDGTHWVWSFDHGHFFYGGPNWTPVSLASSPTAAPDPTIVNTCRLTPEEVQNALPNLRSALNESLALAVSSPAAAWGITMDDRIVLAEHLATRRDRLLT